jgi:hypothetical protein
MLRSLLANLVVRWWRDDSARRSGPWRAWIKVKNPKAPTATYAMAGTMTIAREIELYNSAFSLAWNHVSELRKREKPNIASRLHDSIRSQIMMGATEPLFIASAALRDVEFNPETWD